MSMALTESTGKEPASVHQMMRNLCSRKSSLYWADLLLCAATFWTLLLLGGQSLHWLPVLLIVGSLALYRMALFTHEICHFSRGTLPGFELVWNAVCGVPVLLPSYMLKSHVDHHASRSFGTSADPEHLPFANYPQLRWRFLLMSALVPMVLAMRSLVLVPMAWFVPTARVYLRERFTFMTMNSAYRPNPSMRLTSIDQATEIAASMWAWGLIVSMATGIVAWEFPVLLMTCMTIANALNSWRTLQSHRYENHGSAVNVLAQMRDSTTFTTFWLWGELLYPVGQRFHAAHHLLPYLPYHSLPEAHRRLISMEWAGKANYLETFTNLLPPAEN